MPFNFDIDALSIETGISSEKLSKNIIVYTAMSTVFPLLEISGCEVGLFGGTALNMIYFGKKQRLSYDLDIFSYSASALSILKKAGAKVKYSGMMPANMKRPSARLDYSGAVIDLVNAEKGMEKPQKRQAYSILYYYRQLIPPVVVPSYSLEYLLAEKTMALLDRNELKDIYDTWIGCNLIEDTPKYARYLRAIAKKRDIKDIAAYADYRIAHMLNNIDYYEKKDIETINKASAFIMLKSIRTFLDAMI